MVQVGFEILYEEGPCLVVSKPAGLPTRAAGDADSLELRIKEFFRRRDRTRGSLYLGVADPLDPSVSGAIVFGKNAWSARRIAEQFEGRLVRTFYWALVSGSVQPAEGTWIDHVLPAPDDAAAEIVAAEHPQGRPAVVHYRVLGDTPLGSWLEIELETGRSQYLRIQTAERGWPILGDRLYRSEAPFGVLHADQQLGPIALHARSITLRHPLTQEMISVEAPLPDDWQHQGLPELDDAESADA